MRSKEVDKAIKVMQKDIKDYKAELEIELEDRIDEQRIAYLHQQTTSYETVLAYIEELENARSPYFIPKAIIQIKIEEYKMKILELYKKDLWVEPEYTILKLKYENYIEVLKELLEGEKDVR